jgi:hypothetical protein
MFLRGALIVTPVVMIDALCLRRRATPLTLSGSLGPAKGDERTVYSPLSDFDHQINQQDESLICVVVSGFDHGLGTDY